jgi:hypothetical protein
MPVDRADLRKKKGRERMRGMVGVAWRPIAAAVLALASFALCDGEARADSGPTRVKLTGEIIDSWCQISGIMGVGTGSAHHQCAIWCAVGGVPIGVQGSDGKAYILLKSEDRDTINNPTLIDIQTDQVVVDADAYERDGVNYLVVRKVLENGGIVLKNDADYGIVPFGE